jgi:TP901 family phage tail tape measure protein
MAVVAAQLVAEVSVNGDAAAKNKLQDFGNTVGSTAGTLSKLALGAAAAAGTALIGVGVATTKMAADYQTGLTSLVTGAGETKSNLKMVSDGILQTAVATGSTTKDLVSGAYLIESAGQHGKQALLTLTAASEGARVGAASLADVANGVTTEMTDYASKHLTAAQATNTLIAATAAGKTHLGDLANAMSTVLPTAAAMGVNLTDVSGAMATMTGEGTNAAAASTYLHQMLSALENPAAKGATALKSIGLASSDVSDEMKKSLPGALQMITDHLKTKFPEGSAAYVKALSDISGGSKQMQGMLELTGQHLDTFKGNVASIGDAVKKGGSSIVGWSDVQGTFNYKMDQAKEVVETLGIKIGTALLPVAGDLLGKIVPLISQFGDWLIKSGALKTGIDDLVTGIKTMVSVGTTIVEFFAHNKAAMVGLEIAVIALAGAFGGIMVASLTAMAIAAWAAIVPLLPFIAIGAAVALVIAGIVVAVTHWGEIAHWLQGIWGAVMGWLQGVWSAFSGWFMGLLGSIGAFFTGIWNGIHTAFTTVVNAIVTVGRAAFNLLLAVIMAPINAIVAGFAWLYAHNTYIKQLCDAIVNFFKAAISWVQSAWSAVISWLGSQWQRLSGFASSIWNAITGVIRAAVQAVWAALVSVWSAAISWLSGQWGRLSGMAQTAWNAVVTVFSGVWGRISSTLSSLWTNISGWFSNLAGQAVTWGEGIIKGFISGINNMVGQAGQAAANIVKNVGAFLGFHSPAKEGEGRDIIKWGEGLIHGFQTGVMNAVPDLRAAVSVAVSTGTASMRAPGSPYQIAPQLTQNTQPQIVVQAPPIYLDGRLLTNGLMPYMTNAIRANTAAKF